MKANAPGAPSPHVFLKVLGLVVFIWISAAYGIASTMISERMITEVNDRLPPERRYARNWWHPVKHLRFLEDYWRLGLPRQRLWWQVALGLTMMAAAFAILVVLMVSIEN